MSNTLIEMPPYFRAGSTVSYRRTLADFPPGAGHVLALFVTGPTNLTGITVTPGTTDYLVTIPAASSAAATPDAIYSWLERVTAADGHIEDPGSGVVQILRNLATALAGDATLFEAKQLAKIETQMDKLLDTLNETTSIDGRTAVKRKMHDLALLRSQYQAALRNLSNPGTFGTQIVTRFVNPQE